MEQDNRPVVDLLDMLKARVAAGEPICVTGTPQVGAMAEVTRMAEQAAVETGRPARLFQLVELPLASQYFSVVRNP